MTPKIKDIAAECGVSEQAIRAWCRRNQVAKDAKHSFAIDETTLSAIYLYYHAKPRNQVAQRAKPSCATGETSCESSFGAEIGPSVPWEVYEDLRGQLAVKDDQIRALSDALASAQGQVGAAQLLHAADRKGDLLPLSGATEASGDPAAPRKTRWQRLKEAWRG